MCFPGLISVSTCSATAEVHDFVVKLKCVCNWCVSAKELEASDASDPTAVDPREILTFVSALTSSAHSGRCWLLLK